MPDIRKQPTKLVPPPAPPGVYQPNWPIGPGAPEMPAPGAPLTPEQLATMTGLPAATLPALGPSPATPAGIMGPVAPLPGTRTPEQTQTMSDINKQVQEAIAGPIKMPQLPEPPQYLPYPQSQRRGGTMDDIINALSGVTGQPGMLEKLRQMHEQRAVSDWQAQVGAQHQQYLDAFNRAKEQGVLQLQAEQARRNYLTGLAFGSRAAGLTGPGTGPGAAGNRPLSPELQAIQSKEAELGRKMTSQELVDFHLAMAPPVRASEIRTRPFQQNADRQTTQEAWRMYEPALNSSKLLGVMEANLPEALKGNQQAMVGILSGHVGMTLKLMAGTQVTQGLYQEAMQSDELLRRMASRVVFGPNGLSFRPGVTLTPEEMHQMIGMARLQRQQEWQKSDSGRQMMEEQMQMNIIGPHDPYTEQAAPRRTTMPPGGPRSKREIEAAPEAEEYGPEDIAEYAASRQISPAEAERRMRAAGWMPRKQ